MNKKLIAGVFAAVLLTSVGATHGSAQVRKHFGPYEGANCGKYACVVSTGTAYTMKVQFEGVEQRVAFNNCQPMPRNHPRRPEVEAANLVVFACKDRRGHAYFVHELDGEKRMMSANTVLSHAIDSGKAAYEKAKATGIWGD